MKKRIISAALIFSVCLWLVSCNNAVRVQPEFDGDAASSEMAEKIIAENSKYIMKWDEDTKGIILTERDGNISWGTTPVSQGEEELDELGMPVRKNEMVSSALTIQYSSGGSTAEAFSYDSAVTNGVVRCAIVKNGIRVEYFFSELEIMVPVNYVLCSDYVSVTVDPKEIQENGNMVTGISLAPFWCSASNDSDGAYLMIPSGSGALARVKALSMQGEKFSERVYGNDVSMLNWYTSTEKKNILLPVYGVSNGNMGTLAVIDKGADQALIEASVGSESYKYSTVYATFQLRGYTNNITPIFNDTDVSDIYNKAMTDAEISVRFYPLIGDNASYSGMANTYKNYLIEERGLKRTKNTVKSNLNIIGGTEITKAFLGVPYGTIYPATTASQTSRIISELSDHFEMTVNLKGYGQNGIDIGKIGGGFKADGKIASSGDMKRLANAAKESGTEIYMDFDIVRFSSGSGGYSKQFSSVVNAAGKKAVKYLSDKAVHDDVKESLYYLLKPSKLEKAAQKCGKAANKYGLTGISLSTLSQTAYSDYSDKNASLYHSKTGFSEAASQAIKAGKGTAGKFAAEQPNMYAALLSERITEAPLTSSEENIFSEDIPFYEMVFSGCIPMSGESVNLSDNPKQMLLRSVEAGCAPGYTLIGSWNNKLIDAQYPLFYSSLYSDVKKDIISFSDRLLSYYEAIGASGIESHSILRDGLRKTVFKNGVTVYVNYNDCGENTEAGVVGAADFLIKGAAV